MALWERLHTPFIAAADAEPDLVRRMEGYRTAAFVHTLLLLASPRLRRDIEQIFREDPWALLEPRS